MDSEVNHQFKYGESYFLVGYYDRQFKYPYIQTFVFLGKGTDNLVGVGEQEVWYFQDPKYFLEKDASVLRNDYEKEGIVIAMDDTIEAYVDVNGLIEFLAARGEHV